MIRVVAALTLQLIVGVATVTPPTEFDLAKAEGDSFVATLRAALDKLSPSWMTLPQRRVVHLLGASEAEDLVDWSSLCKMANPPSLVFIGPQVVERQTGSCVHTLKGLYSHDKVHKAVPALSTPDLILIYNADLHMCPWRRTLVELLQSGRPVVLTTYCEHEGAMMQRLFRSPDLFDPELVPAALESCDAIVRHLPVYGIHAEDHATVGRGLVPWARELWPIEANPNAPLPPLEDGDCSVRNSYWMAFHGAAASAKEEL
jgi:hypothetical protein